jgi:hypothetical protein
MGATGQMTYDLPPLVVNQDTLVVLDIVPDMPVASLDPSAALQQLQYVRIATPEGEGKHEVVVAIVGVYPVMEAVLTTLRDEDLVIEANNAARQDLAANGRGHWTWGLVAKKGDRYQINLSVKGYAFFEDTTPAGPEIFDSRYLTAQEQALGAALTTGVRDNWRDLLGANGPIALLVTVGTLVITFLGYRLARGGQGGGKNTPKSG